MEPVTIWTWVSRVQGLLSLLGIVLAIVVFVCWWLTARLANWLVWGIAFYPPKVAREMGATNTGIVTLTFAVVNPWLTPKVIEDVALTLQYEEDDLTEYKFEPAAFMECLPIKKVDDKKVETRLIEFFRPFIVPAKSDVSKTVLFLPTQETQWPANLRLGTVRARLLFEREDKVWVINFRFRIDEDIGKTHNELQEAIWIPSRRIESLPLLPI